MILCIDFDGVIHNPHDKDLGYRLGKPIEGTVEAVRGLYKENTIIIFTVWGTDENKTTIEAWLSYFEIPYHEVTNIKPQADWYIDDKGYHFESWKKTLKDIVQ